MPPPRAAAHVASAGGCGALGCSRLRGHEQALSEPRAQQGRPGSTCTRPAVPRSCQRPLRPRAERTASHRARHFWPPRIGRSECFCLGILFPLTRLDVKSEPGGTRVPFLSGRHRGTVRRPGLRIPQEHLAQSPGGGVRGCGIWGALPSCADVPALLLAGLSGSEGGASGGGSGPQSQMWPWRDGVEAGVCGHADRVLSLEPRYTGSRIQGKQDALLLRPPRASLSHCREAADGCGLRCGAFPRHVSLSAERGLCSLPAMCWALCAARGWGVIRRGSRPRGAQVY